MPNHLSTIGIAHTAIGIIAVSYAINSLARYGTIKPSSTTGKWYIALTVIACVSSFPIMNSGHPTAGHAFAVMILIMFPLAIYAHTIRLFGNKADYVQTILMSTTLFLSLIPAVVETLTRVPVSQPIASSQEDPIVKMGVGILFMLFVSGVIYQVLKRRALRKTAPAQSIKF